MYDICDREGKNGKNNIFLSKCLFTDNSTTMAKYHHHHHHHHSIQLPQRWWQAWGMGFETQIHLKPQVCFLFFFFSTVLTFIHRLPTVIPSLKIFLHNCTWNRPTTIVQQHTTMLMALLLSMGLADVDAAVADDIVCSCTHLKSVSVTIFLIMNWWNDI